MPKFSRVLLNNVKFGRSCGGADPLLLSPLGLPLSLCSQIFLCFGRIPLCLVSEGNVFD
ncbi:unnamed protein product [Musa hybrid cultivar]